MELNAQMSSEVELGYLANRHFLSLFPVHGINPHNSSTPQYPFAHYPIRAVSRSVLVVVVVVVRSRVLFFFVSCFVFLFYHVPSSFSPVLTSFSLYRSLSYSVPSCCKIKDETEPTLTRLNPSLSLVG